MTVNELIEHLKSLPVEHRNLEVRIWLPGSHIILDGNATQIRPGPLNALPVVIVEGNIAPGSALIRDTDEDITF